jgi:histone-lysine N-methyltransferase SETMAR
MSKVAARWVPRNLSSNNRHERVQCSKQLLELYTADKDKFLSRVITGDETWVHHYDPESKSESMQWKHPWSPPPRKFRTQASAGKIMATIFWDNKGVLLVDYLPPKNYDHWRLLLQNIGKIEKLNQTETSGIVVAGGTAFA